MTLTAHRIRAALERCDGTFRSDGVDPSRAKPAAVVLPIVLADEPSALFVLRSSHLKDHAGEIGFPGGKPEPTDPDLRATALRELGEEVGLGPDDVEWCGRLSARVVITGRYLIHPFVAVVREDASPRVMSSEIEAILSLPLAPIIRGEVPFYALSPERRGEWGFVPYFKFPSREPRVLYGASAVIFYELLTLLSTELSMPFAEPILEDQPSPWEARYPSE